MVGLEPTISGLRGASVASAFGSWRCRERAGWLTVRGVFPLPHPPVIRGRVPRTFPGTRPRPFAQPGSFTLYKVFVLNNDPAPPAGFRARGMTAPNRAGLWLGCSYGRSISQSAQSFVKWDRISYPSQISATANSHAEAGHDGLRREDPRLTVVVFRFAANRTPRGNRSGSWKGGR